ncbi:hypothetical protein QCN29_30260 [Streptomyces sp. HNM0663]|uniref:Uncharacterized protein n=1 Tax=Streptomyces chengmaiensis TaxID=3040919 RepID=A0ABT6HXA3_9ACTN|nr:hypothetical protein [Streptomyces chengmaiensis]MDH2392986.1 hypothetical protein [Streptomyces chengmaiensis]
MEILLAACLLAWAAGAQSERAALGISPAQRELIKEQVRHDKTVRKIAEKHGATPPATNHAGVSPWKEPAASGEGSLTVPEAFRAGYRGHTAVARVATPMGRRVGSWAARGVAWGKDTGRGALREYRKRRQAAGEPDPAPVAAPIPPMPAEPPTVWAEDGWEPEEAEKPPEWASEPPAEDDGGDWFTNARNAPRGPAEGHAPVPGPRSPADEAPQPAANAPDPTPDPGDGGVSKTTIDDRGGVGRMASEVSYDSVMEESDELSLMCEDDVQVYGRIRQRCEREIGRADQLVAQLEDVGAGPTVIGWVTRCSEQYQVLLAQLDELEKNTISQGEAVVKAKALLEAGQGYYADIAADMESVADRDFYISDQVDGEDTSAETETYETRGAHA